MRKIKIWVRYPWEEASDDEVLVEVSDDATGKDIGEYAYEVISDIVWNRVSFGWEEV